MEKNRRRPKRVWLLSLVWLIRLCGRMASKKRRAHYRLDEAIKNEIIRGGHTRVIVGERVASAMKIIPCEVCASSVCWVVDPTKCGDLMYLEVAKT